MLGELIVAGLTRNGGVLSALTLNVSNVSVDAKAAGRIPEGNFVAVTIRGSGDWGPETTWTPSSEPGPPLESVQAAAAAADAQYLYSRILTDDAGSVTVLMPARRPVDE